MNFRCISHVETFAVVAQLLKRVPEFGDGIPARHEGTAEVPQKSLLLRGPADKSDPEKWLKLQDLDDTKLYREWKSARALVGKIEAALKTDAAATALDLEAPLGRIMISGLAGDRVMIPHVDTGPYNDKHARFHVALVTNPGAICYSRHESVHMAVGGLWWFNNKVAHWVANWGQATRYHLIIDVPLKPIPEKP